MSKMAFRFSLTVILLSFVGFAFCKTDEETARIKRADDSDPLRPVVEQLTQQVQQLQAQYQALKTGFDDQSTTVGFTVRMRNAKVQGLGLHQIVKFDNVIFNAGNAYSVNTGQFTTPFAGTYLLMLTTMRYSEEDPYIGLSIMRNGSRLGRAHAGYSRFESGSSGLYVVHLNKGDVVHVEVDGGTVFEGDVHTVFSGFRAMP